MITQTLKLNLIPGQVLPRVNVSQYDAGTRTLQMLLYNGDQAFNIPTGYGGFVQGTKPDRTGFQYAATVTEGSNVVTLVVTQQMAAVSGEVTCELVIANGDDRIATVNFILYVEPAALADDTVISDTELPLIEEAAELAQRIDAITTQIDADADRAEAAADDAELWASRSPYIGPNGNWFVFNSTTEQYVDTQIPATGPQGPQGDDGPTGPQGPTGPTGNGIVSITKTGTSGLVDTYTILFTDGTTTTFTVTNGQDGQGSGDMTKAVYDSTNAVADAGGIVAYVSAHSGAGTLAGLTDVEITNAQDGQEITYDGTTQKWKNTSKIQTLTNQVKDMNNVYGSKNLLSQKYMQVLLRSTPVGNKVESINGLTIVYGEDGSIEINGTPTDSSKSVAIHFDWTTSVYDYNIENLAGEKVIGSITDTQINGIRLLLGCFLSDGTANQSGYIYTNGEYTYPSDAVWGRTWLSISGEYSYNHAKVYPMIRLASITDDTYEPYAKTNRELTNDVSTVKQALTTQALYFTSVACSATTGNFLTKSDANITADHVVAECTFANPSAITSDVTWTTASGSVTLNGTCASATTANLVLVKKGN